MSSDDCLFICPLKTKNLLIKFLEGLKVDPPEGNHESHLNTFNRTFKSLYKRSN